MSFVPIPGRVYVMQNCREYDSGGERMPEWNGTIVECVGVSEYHWRWKPITNRPDGAGLREFIWRTGSDGPPEFRPYVSDLDIGDPEAVVSFLLGN